jgi:homoserine dehydrogenase
VPERIVVLKFGSSVLRSHADLPSVVHEIYRWYRGGAHVIAVVSAIGNATEQLIRQSREMCSSPEPWATAELLATGERTSAALLGIALDRAGVPARVVNPREIGLEVRGQPLDGEPFAINRKHIDELLAEYPVLVVPGFFGTDAFGRTQLLGRGGSDLTAVFLAVSLGAERARLLKDTDGVYESDPAVANSHPKRFAALNYADALKVAGKLIQPKAVTFLASHQAHAEVAALALPYQSVVHGGETELAQGAANPPCGVVVLGLGTVGFGLYQRLLSLPTQFRVLGALVRDRAKYEAAGVPPQVLHTSAETLRDLQPTLVIDALPGVEPSGALLKAYLARGIDIVSANKTVVADQGASLEHLAQASGATLRYAAAVGGSAPMLERVSDISAHGEIDSIAAVLNGTCNFVLDRCGEGNALEEVVTEAQRCGFAEADPRDDLSGRDAERKLRILARQGFGVTLDTVALQAFDKNVARQAHDAARAGMKLRQIARIARTEARIVAAVAFEPVEPGSFFGALERDWNGLEVRYASGQVIALRGRGAGRWPTTEAAMADIFDAMRARGCGITAPRGAVPDQRVQSAERFVTP